MLNQRVGMADSLAGVALAAGAGTRLRPLTDLRPKPLCPLGDRPLIDHALGALSAAAGDLAVNVHHGADAVRAHVLTPAGPWSPPHVSFEAGVPLGTAGALGQLRDWIGPRDVLVVNSDTWHGADLNLFAESWDRGSIAVLTDTPGPFGPRSGVVASLLPAERVGALQSVPGGLWEVLWAPEVAEGRLVTMHTDAPVYDCGTPRSYLEANLAWAAIHGPGDNSGVAPHARVADSVLGEGAVVKGSIDRCVIWPGARVAAGEKLRGAIRADHLTVLVR